MFKYLLTFIVFFFIGFELYKIGVEVAIASVIMMLTLLYLVVADRRFCEKHDAWKDKILEDIEDYYG